MKSLIQFLLENSIEQCNVDRTKRMKKNLKKKLFDIHGGCQICGEGTLGGSRIGKILEVHHYTPRNQGGTETIDNAVLLCRPCHADVHNNKIESPKPTVEK